MNLMKIMGGISEKHIAEFAEVKPNKRKKALWLKIASAACISIIAVAVFTVRRFPHKDPLPIASISENSSDISSGSTSVGSNSSDLSSVSTSGGTDPEDPSGEALPQVRFNNITYVIDGDLGKMYGGYELDEFPGEYVEVGEITTNDKKDKTVNGYGEGPDIGDKIYQRPGHPCEIFVRTKLFMGGEKYWYMGFAYGSSEWIGISGIDSEGHGKNRSYFVDFADVNEAGGYDELPEGCKFVYSITEKRRLLNIGDAVYQDPDHPDVAYVYTSAFLSEKPKYVKFVLRNGY